MRRPLHALAALLLLAAPLATADLEETAFFDNTIAVYWSTDPSTYAAPLTSPPSIPIPASSDGVCVVDTSVIDAIRTGFTYGPSVITVRTEDLSEGFDREPFALAACMDELVDVLNTRYPGAKVLLDVTWLFWTDHLRNTLYANHVDAARTFWEMAQASGSVLPASSIYGLVVNDEAYNATNTALNWAVQHGVDQWTSWIGVDRWAGFDLADHFPANPAYDKTVNGGNRANYGFPWRYNVISTGAYWVYNPRVPGHPLNPVPMSGQLFDERWATFVSRLQAHQRPHINVRAFWGADLDNSGWTHGGTGWSIEDLKWATRAWCRWIKDHPEVTSMSFWSYDQHSLRLGALPSGTPDDPDDSGDDADDASEPLIQASTLYDSGSSYYVPNLKTFHDTVLRHGGSSFNYCP